MRILIILSLLLNYHTCFAKEVGGITGLPLPRFVTLKAYETNLRKGPSSSYPIAWTYYQKGYPLKLVAEFEHWRKLVDHDGSEGWVHENLITGIRNGVVINDIIHAKNLKYQLPTNQTLLFYHPDENSYPVARLEFGVSGRLKKCQENWCQIKIHNYTGWIRKENLWGVMQDEIFK